MLYSIVVLERSDGLPEILKGKDGKPALFPYTDGHSEDMPSEAGLAGERAIEAKPFDYINFEIWNWEKTREEYQDPCAFGYE